VLLSLFALVCLAVCWYSARSTPAELTRQAA
jgi:hypothetical protein